MRWGERARVGHRFDCRCRCLAATQVIPRTGCRRMTQHVFLQIDCKDSLSTRSHSFCVVFHTIQYTFVYLHLDSALCYFSRWFESQLMRLYCLVRNYHNPYVFDVKPQPETCSYFVTCLFIGAALHSFIRILLSLYSVRILFRFVIVLFSG